MGFDRRRLSSRLIVASLRTLGNCDVVSEVALCFSPSNAEFHQQVRGWFWLFGDFFAEPNYLFPF